MHDPLTPSVGPQARSRGAAISTSFARRLLSALLPPLALALHAGNLWRLTGDPLALFHAQSAWGRGLSAPWAFLIDRPGTHPWTAPLDRAALLLFLALGLALWRAHRGAAAYVLLSLVPAVLSGSPMSGTRLVLVLFPALVPLARLAARPAALALAAAAFAALQALLFAAWSRFHWVA